MRRKKTGSYGGAHSRVGRKKRGDERSMKTNKENKKEVRGSAMGHGAQFAVQRRSSRGSDAIHLNKCCLISLGFVLFFFTADGIVIFLKWNTRSLI